MRARERAPAPQPPPIIPAVAPGSSSVSVDQYTTLSAQLREHDMEMSINFEWIEHRVQNDLQYICSSIRYLQTCVDETYSRNAWSVPLPRGHSQPLPTSVLRLIHGYLLQLLSRYLLLQKILTFRKIDPFC